MAYLSDLVAEQATELNGLAMQLAQGEIEAAIATFDQALGFFHQRWEHWYWHAALASAWRSEAVLQQGNIEEAIDGLLSAVPHLQDTLGTDHPVSNHWLTRLAEVSTFSR